MWADDGAWMRADGGALSKGKGKDRCGQMMGREES